MSDQHSWWSSIITLYLPPPSLILSWENRLGFKVFDNDVDQLDSLNICFIILLQHLVKSHWPFVHTHSEKTDSNTFMICKVDLKWDQSYNLFMIPKPVTLDWRLIFRNYEVYWVNVRTALFNSVSMLISSRVNSLPCFSYILPQSKKTAYRISIPLYDYCLNVQFDDTLCLLFSW